MVTLKGGLCAEADTTGRLAIEQDEQVVERRLMHTRQDSEQPCGSDELAQGCETRLDIYLNKLLFKYT